MGYVRIGVLCIGMAVTALGGTEHDFKRNVFENRSRDAIADCEPPRASLRQPPMNLLVQGDAIPDVLPDVPKGAVIERSILFQFEKPQRNPAAKVWNWAVNDRPRGFKHHGLVFFVRYRMPGQTDPTDVVFHGPSAGDYDVDEFRKMLDRDPRSRQRVLGKGAGFYVQPKNLDNDADSVTRLADSDSPRYKNLKDRAQLNRALFEMRREVEAKKVGKAYSCKSNNADQNTYYNCQIECIWACKKLEELFPTASR